MEGYFSIAIGIIDLENDQKKKRKKSEMMIRFGCVLMNVEIKKKKKEAFDNFEIGLQQVEGQIWGYLTMTSIS